MKHKTNMRKLITVTVLSACMAICSIGAFGGLKSAKVYAASVQTSSLSGIFEASGGASVTYGSKEMVTLKYNASKDVSHKGLILTGGTGAEFSLKNPIDLTKGKWVGANNASNVPIINYAVAPEYNQRQTTDGSNNNKGIDKDFGYDGFTVTLTDAQDSSKYINVIVKAVHPNDDNQSLAGGTIGANANGQTLGATKASGSTLQGFSAGSQPFGIGFTGNVEEARDLVYDYETNALYTSYGRAGRTNYLIRSFGNFDNSANNPSGVKSYDTTDEAVEFSGKFYLTIKFNAVESSVETASIVLTNIGGYDLTQETLDITDSDYIPALNANSVKEVKVNQTVDLYAPVGASPVMVETKAIENFTATVKFGSKQETAFTASDFVDGKKSYSFTKPGVYTVDYVIGDKVLTQTITVNEGEILPESLINSFTASSGASVTYGSKEMATLKYNASKEVSHTGLILTGGSNATFTLNKPINLTNSKWYGANSLENTPIMEFAFAPEYNQRQSSAYNGGIDIDFIEPQGIDITLTDAEDPSKFIFISLKTVHPNDDNKTNAGGKIGANANGQVFGSTKANSASSGYTSFEKSAQAYGIGFTGNVDKPRDLVYDFETNSLYTSYGRAGRTNYLIRSFGNFDDPVNNPSGIKSYDDTDEAVEFSGKFYLSIKFGALDEEITSTSLVLTSIAGAKFVDDKVEVDRTLDIVTESKENPVKKELAFGEKFILPTFEVSNVWVNNEIPFVGSYVVTKLSNARTSNIVAEGEYVAGEDITDKIKQAGVGTYLVTCTTSRLQSVSVEYTVYPSLNVSGINNAKILLDGEEQTGTYIVFDGNKTLAIEPTYGYELSGLKINGASFANGAKLDTLFEVKDENVVSASILAKEYTLTFSVPASENYTGAIPSDIVYTIDDVNNIALPQLSKDGYDFLGWTYNGKKIETINDFKDENEQIVLGDYELVGYFGEQTFVVSYYDGETLLKEVHVVKGNAPLSFVPEKDGYTFDGWVDASNNAVTLTNINANTSVYAKWITKSTVGGGEGGGNNVDADFNNPNNGLKPLDIVGICAGGVGVIAAVVVIVLIIRKKKRG